MTDLVIYTASFGNHDKPQEIYDLPPGVTPICFTDDPSLTRKTWRVIMRPRVFAHPRMDAKWYKMSSCHLFPNVGRTVYIDSSIWVWDAPAFIAKCLGAMDDDHEVAFFEHPEGQTSLWGEAAHSLTMPKYEGSLIEQQVRHYESVHPTAYYPRSPSGRIFAGGIIARNHSLSISGFEKKWFDECIHWSVQDQISLPYVLWHETPYVQAATIPGDIYHDDHHLHLWSGPGK